MFPVTCGSQFLRFCNTISHFWSKSWSVLVGSAVDFWPRSGSVPADLQEMHRNHAFPMDSNGFLEARGSFWTTFRSLAGHNFFVSAIPFRMSAVSPGRFWFVVKLKIVISEYREAGKRSLGIPRRRKRHLGIPRRRKRRLGIPRCQFSEW